MRDTQTQQNNASVSNISSKQRAQNYSSHSHADEQDKSLLNYLPQTELSEQRPRFVREEQDDAYEII
jgi:hypothetical protein